MRKQRNRSSSLMMEPLENRRLLSASFLSQLSTTPTVTANTVPTNGDVNPYGVAFVPNNAAGGSLVAGDVLVSNFNNSSNLQGTGSTIVQINPQTGAQTLFYQGQTGLGLTTALGVLKDGFVLVGNVPTPDGMNVTPPGSLIILNNQGQVVENLTDSALLDGPWDLTVAANGNNPYVFVSNVLNGTVSRLDFKVSDKHGTASITLESETLIASGYGFRTDPNALVVGPTGLVYDSSSGALYVASAADNVIYKINNAENRNSSGGTGKVVFTSSFLRGPVGLAMAPNGDLLATNGDAVNSDPIQTSEIVEFTKSGKFVDEFQISNQAGGAFGLAFETEGNTTIFAAVNDSNNTLEIWSLNNNSGNGNGNGNGGCGFSFSDGGGDDNNWWWL